MNKEVHGLSFVAFSMASEYLTVEPMGIYIFHDNSYICGLHFQCLCWSTLGLLSADAGQGNCGIWDQPPLQLSWPQSDR